MTIKIRVSESESSRSSSFLTMVLVASNKQIRIFPIYPIYPCLPEASRFKKKILGIVITKNKTRTYIPAIKGCKARFKLSSMRSVMLELSLRSNLRPVICS